MKVKIEFKTNDKNDQFYHVYKKESFLEKWEFTGKFGTIEEAHEWALSRDEKVIFTGLYNKGQRSGVFCSYPDKL